MTKRMLFVAFWSESAWVAGTVFYGCVAQGLTLSQAIDRLKQTLRSEAAWQRQDLQEPFSALDDEHKAPLPKFAFVGTESPLPPGDSVPDKSLRYKGVVEVPLL